MYIFEKYYCKPVVKDYRILKLIFTIFGLWLISYSIYTFVVVKPTYTSNEQREKGVEDFPEIIICPEPTFDINALTSRGYEGDYFQYFVGSPEFGWAGNKSEDVRKVFMEVSTLKTVGDCPLGFHRFVDTRSVAEFSMTRALYPFHLCCKIIHPNISEFHPITYLKILINGTSNLRSFKVFLADQLTASFYDLHKRIMLGDKLVSNGNGLMNYNVKIIEDVKLQGDPKYPCIDYKIVGKYSECVEKEMVGKSLQIMNCTPPWMTDNENLWCEGKRDTQSNSGPYFSLMRDISVSQASAESCLVPCRMKMYQAREVGLREIQNIRGLIIRFENEVDIIKSSWKMNVETLLSEIGGFIGLNKNFLWILTLFLSTMSIICSNLKLKIMPKTL